MKQTAIISAVEQLLIRGMGLFCESIYRIPEKCCMLILWPLNDIGSKSIMLWFYGCGGLYICGPRNEITSDVSNYCYHKCTHFFRWQMCMTLLEVSLSFSTYICHTCRTLFAGGEFERSLMSPYLYNWTIKPRWQLHQIKHDHAIFRGLL